MDTSIRYSLYFDNCDEDAINRLKEIFGYDPNFPDTFVDGTSIINNLFGVDTLLSVDQDWIDENVGVSDFSGFINEIDLINHKVSVTISSPSECLPLLESIMSNIITSYCPDVFLSGDYNRFDYTEVGCIVGDRVITKSPMDISSFNVGNFIEGSEDYESFKNALFDHRSTKFSDFLISLES